MRFFIRRFHKLGFSFRIETSSQTATQAHFKTVKCTTNIFRMVHQLVYALVTCLLWSFINHYHVISSFHSLLTISHVYEDLHSNGDLRFYMGTKKLTPDGATSIEVKFIYTIHVCAMRKSVLITLFWLHSKAFKRFFITSKPITDQPKVPCSFSCDIKWQVIWPPQESHNYSRGCLALFWTSNMATRIIWLS